MRIVFLFDSAAPVGGVWNPDVTPPTPLYPPLSGGQGFGPRFIFAKIFTHSLFFKSQKQADTEIRPYNSGAFIAAQFIAH